MKRKDILIIAAILIVIAFVAVLFMYYAVNYNTHTKVTEEASSEIVKKEYHSNGWETDIVGEIKGGVPIPVGFTHVENSKRSGLIIKDNSTNQEYMWIPYYKKDEVYLDESIRLNNISEESEKNIQKYNGFYVAIENMEEAFNNFVNANIADYETYGELKKLGYEIYSKKYKEQTGEDFDIGVVTEEKLEETKLINISRTDSVETHLMSAEEKALVDKYQEKLGEKIYLKDYKALTILSTNNESEFANEDEMVSLAMAFLETVITNEKTDKIKEDIGYDKNINYEEDEEAYAELKDKLLKKLNSDENFKNAVYKTMKEGVAGYIDENGEYHVGLTTDNNIVTKVVDGVPIPKGFEYVEGDLNSGFKIKNGENLRFIWIPVEVEDNKDIAETIKDKFIAKLEEVDADSELEVDKYKEYKDDTEGNTEYEALIKSIKTYGGFYISEAELGYDTMGSFINIYRPMYERYGEGTGKNYVSDGDYYRNIEDENLYYKDTEGNLTWSGKLQDGYELTYESAIEKCKELYDVSESVVSHLTYGLEYDATVLYLLEKGVITKEQAFNDSNEVGKYWTKDESKKEKLWFSLFDLNGIYGLGGNLSEITREKDGENVIARGGNWYTEGNKEQLASKVSMTKEELTKDDGKIGFRACLYIKTEYEDVTEKIGKLKEQAKEEFETNIKAISVIDEETKENIFKLEIPAVQKIVEETKAKIESQTNSTTIREEAYDGLEQIEIISEWINVIKNYPDEEKINCTFTWGTEEEKVKCEKIKNEAIEKIKKLTWEDGVFKYEGKTITLEEITKDALKEITETREEFRKKIIKEQIENYPTGKDKDYVVAIKKAAKKGEISWTSDFTKININQEGNYLEKWQYLIEQAVAFDNEYTKDKEYYKEWQEIKKDFLNQLSNEEYLSKISTEVVTKADIEVFVKETRKTAEEKIKEVINNKKAEEEAKKKAEQEAEEARKKAQAEAEAKKKAEEEAKKKAEMEQQQQQQQQQQTSGVDGIIANMSLDEKIYQMFFVTPEAITKVSAATAARDTTKQALKKYPVGGIIYFAQNIQNKNQITQMISNTQSYSTIPLFIGVDEEGGSVSRLGAKTGTGVTRYGAMWDVGIRGNTQEAYNIGKDLGNDISALGFNLDFAPVADVLVNSNNTEIGRRSFGTNANSVAGMVENFVRGMEETKVSSVLKHFPGHGSTTANSHNGYSGSNRTLDQLRTTEFIPFKRGIQAGSDLVMISHMTLVNAVGNEPASISKKVITDLLKSELGFKGIAITDAMNMGAITTDYTGGNAEVKAIQAGIDMLLMPKNIDQAFSAIKTAVQNGNISEERINESVRRILTVKKEKIW